MYVLEINYPIAQLFNMQLMKLVLGAHIGSGDV